GGSTFGFGAEHGTRRTSSEMHTSPPATSATPTTLGGVFPGRSSPPPMSVGSNPMPAAPPTPSSKQGDGGSGGFGVPPSNAFGAPPGELFGGPPPSLSPGHDAFGVASSAPPPPPPPPSSDAATRSSSLGSST
ncbi:unnamed protein product, partial [Ectocarpus sp. 8 AP-2014]